jgi:anaerobic C4-dicarboxylate transporter
VTDRRARVLWIAAGIAILAASLIFRVRIAVAGLKYMIVLIAIVVGIAMLTAKGDRKK